MIQLSMPRLSSLCASFATVLTLLLAPAAPAHAWWACPSGYDSTVQARNSNTQVRCTSPEQTRNLDECPNATAGGITVGTGLKMNYTGTRDKCVGYIAGKPVVVLDPTCNGGGSGYSVQVSSQTDRCRKPGGEAAPTRNVN